MRRTSPTFAWCTFSVLLLVRIGAFADTLHVPEEFATIQAAIDAAADGDEIIVAAGTYSETIDFRGKSITVASVFGASQTIIDASFIGGDVITCASLEGDALLEGFTITGGRGHRSNCGGVRGTNGGGVFVDYGSRVTVRDCAIVGNSVTCCGGGVASDGTTTLIRCRIEANSPHGIKTGLDCSMPTGGCDASVRLEGCVVRNNQIGVVAGPGSHIEHCLFELNTDSGAIACGDSSAPFTLRTSTIARNGRGLSLYGPGQVVRCLVIGNTAEGGVRWENVDGQSALLADSALVGNAGPFAGALICHGQLAISNCTIAGNRAGEMGGGLFCGSGYSDDFPTTVTLMNSTLWDNDAPQGKQIALIGPFATLSTADNDVSGGQAGTYVDSGGILDWGPGNIAADPLFLRNPTDGGDGWGDDPETPDFDESSNDNYGDLRLSADSPCIDVGDLEFDPSPGATDLDGLFRIWDGDADGEPIVDMGAYEFGSHTYGDLNCDGGVDFNDIDAFVAALAGRDEYEQSFPDCAYLLADVNADGSVDFGDIDPFVNCLIDGGCN